MPFSTSFPTTQIILTGIISLTLASCDSNPGPGPDIHDSKYVSMDEKGELLTPGESGPCVLDQFTGLVWETKTDKAGLYNKDNTYSWFNPNEDSSGELDYRGIPNGGQCEGSDCDTYAVVAAASENGRCGFSDWRLPTRDELGSISDPRKTSTPPSINTVYFPHTQSGDYWSSNDYQFHWNTAWLWNFGNGLDRVEWKESQKYVRLVRGEANYLERIKD